MPQDELSQLAELLEREVRGEGGLHTFFTLNSNANVRLEDHTNIIASISDTGNPFSIGVVLECLADISLLSWGASTNTDTRCLDGLVEELVTCLF